MDFGSPSSIRKQHGVPTHACLQPYPQPCLNLIPRTVDHGPGLPIAFGNQLWVLFEGVGSVAAQSAARGPRFYDGLAETSDRGLIKL